MKILITSLLLSLSLSSLAWKISHKNGIFILKSKKFITEVISEGGKPQFLSEVKINKRFSYIIYLAGTAGTYSPVKIKRAVIIDKKENKSLGDFPYHYEGTTKAKITQPKWNVLKNKMLIKIVDKESGTRKTIRLK